MFMVFNTLRNLFKLKTKTFEKGFIESVDKDVRGIDKEYKRQFTHRVIHEDELHNNIRKFITHILIFMRGVRDISILMKNRDIERKGISNRLISIIVQSINYSKSILKKQIAQIKSIVQLSADSLFIIGKELSRDRTENTRGEKGWRAPKKAIMAKRK